MYLHICPSPHIALNMGNQLKVGYSPGLNTAHLGLCVDICVWVCMQVHVETKSGQQVSLSFALRLISLCVWVHNVPKHVCRSEDDTHQSVLSFHCGDLRKCTRVPDLVGSLLARPSTS